MSAKSLDEAASPILGLCGREYCVENSAER
jgi:hypothetical protein